ncbi:MAG: DUF1018 domain-containing protein [Defluviicoccus sp.]|nr:DUF1018 domain-containing protein [Defluviicoccus sp.]
MTDPARIRRAIFARCREAGIDDAARHDIQLRATGKASLTDMSPAEMGRVLRALGRGSKPAAGGRPAGEPRTAALPVGPHTAKLRALWISGYWLGVVRDKSDAALAAFIRRQAGIDAARWATPAQSSACIEALKDWLARDGGVDWSPYAVAGRKPKHVPGARVLEALWRALHEAGAVRIGHDAALHAWVTRFRGDSACYTALPASTLARLHRELGEWLRGVSE